MMKTLCGPLGPGPMAVNYDGISPCFSSLVLDSLPVAILLVHIWPQCRSIYRRRRTMSLVDRSVSFWIQMTCCLFMAMFPIAILSVHLINVDPEDVYSYIYPYELIAQLTQFAAWLCGSFIVSLANAYDAPLNYGIRLWWITNFIISCKDVQSQAMRLTEGKDLSSLLIISCIRVFVSAFLAVDSILSLKWIIHRVFRFRFGRTDLNMQDLHHPWLQIQQEFTPSNSSLSNSQIWNTWLACGIPPATVDSLDSKNRRIKALSLLSWFEGIDTKGEPYVHFSIEVEPADLEEKSWVFSSSFSDWMWLGHAVKKAYQLQNSSFDLPEFPESIKHCSVAEIASILQLYFHRAVECLSIQASLLGFLETQTKLQYTEKEISHGRAGVISHVKDIQRTERSPKLIENRFVNVRQKFNEVITTPIAAILERKIRSPSEEVIFFQTRDSHEKIIAASVVRYDIDQQPIAFEINVSSRVSRWSVRRRFKQFLELHSKLQHFFDDRLLPVLPSKSLLLSSQHSAFLENRRRQLDIFIQSIVNVDYFACRPLYDFLSNDRVECSGPCEPDVTCGIDQVHKFGIIINKWEFSDSSDYRFNPIYYFEIYEYFSLNQYLKWTIHSTLSDFKELHSSLRRRFPNDVVPDLPKWYDYTKQ